MKQFTNSIEQSIRDKNWFGAVFISLAMPDICATAQLGPPGKREIGKRYKNWFDTYLKNSYAIGGIEETHFTSDDCWAFRCSCLHSGLDAQSKDRLRKFSFTPPIREGFSVHLNNNSGVVQIQIDLFARDVCTAVEKWMEDMRCDETVQERINELMVINLQPLDGFIRFS